MCMHDECSEQSSLIFSSVPFFGFDELFISFVCFNHEKVYGKLKKGVAAGRRKGLLKVFSLSLLFVRQRKPFKPEQE